MTSHTPPPMAIHRFELTPTETIVVNLADVRVIQHVPDKQEVLVHYSHDEWSTIMSPHHREIFRVLTTGTLDRNTDHTFLLVGRDHME